MRFLIVAVWVGLMPLAAAASPAEELAAQFVDVLRSDDLSLLAKLVDATQPDARAWEELRDVLDRHDCVTVARYDWSLTSESEDRLVLRVDLDGTAALKAAWRPERRLPRSWEIEARRSGGSWRIWSAMTGERRIALDMLAAPSEIGADRIAAEAIGANILDVVAKYALELRWARKVERFEHALSFARANADISTEVAVIHQYVAVGKVSDSTRLSTARRGVELARSSGSNDALANALLVLGIVHLTAGERDQAREVYAAGAALVDRVDDPTMAMKCLQMHIRTGFVSPLETLRKTELLAELARRYEWEEGEEVALFNHSDVQSELGNLDVARADCLKLIRLGETRGNRRFVAMAKFNLAVLEIRALRPEQAAVHLLEALPLFPLDRAVTMEILLQLASALIEIGRLEEAEEWIRKAEAIQSTVGDADVRASIRMQRSRLHLRRGETEKAVAMARDGFRELDPKEVTAFQRRAALLGALARALKASGRNEEAIAEYRHAVAEIEGRQEQIGADALGLAAFLRDYADIYVELVESLVAAGNIDEALRIAEQMKARGLREAIATSHIDLSASMSAEERSREQTLETRVLELNRALLAARQEEGLGREQQLEGLEPQLADARIELDAFRSEIGLKRPGVGRRRFDAPSALVLPEGSHSLALVEYVVASGQVIAFIVTGDSPVRAMRLPITRETLERQSRELTQLLAARSPEYRAVARRLYATLLAPIEQHFDSVEALAIIPDGILWAVPFHALVAADGRYLADDHSVFYAHSLTLLRRAKPLPAEAPSHLLALGNPTTGANTRSTARAAFRDVSFGSLVDAEAEVRSLSSMYPPEESRVYYGNAASEATFKKEAPGFRVIHLAAHAIVDDRAPMYSSIVLAGGVGAEDGLLEAREVVDLPLAADLAVLSACETARGRVGAGEGVIGLSWAFFAAGCPTTVVSQWSAESAATAKLMIEFHRRLRAGDTTAMALRRAQTALRRMPKYSHPFYWAPFIAVGAANHVF